MREETILRKIRSGDPAGLEALMERYLPYVSAVVWSVLRDAMPPGGQEHVGDHLLAVLPGHGVPQDAPHHRGDGEEVVSDVFLAAWRQGEIGRAHV